MAQSASADHDMIIIGGGPAGLSAGIYGARAGLDAVLFEMLEPGGQIAISSVLENYPGINSISGIEFGEMLAHHAEEAGCKIIRDEATKIERLADGRFRATASSGAVTGRTLIYAAGSEPRRAGFKNEDRYTGRGVSYCATCDGMLFRDKEVYVIGSGQSACEEAEYLSRMASHVTMLVRGESLKGSISARRALECNPRVELRYRSELVSLDGGDFPERITVKDLRTGACTTREPGPRQFGIFVFAGYQPCYNLVLDLVDIENDAVATDSNMRTRTPGLFAIGDVRNTVLRQAVTAVADGAIAAMGASRYIDGMRF